MSYDAWVRTRGGGRALTVCERAFMDLVNPTLSIWVPQCADRLRMMSPEEWCRLGDLAKRSRTTAWVYAGLRSSGLLRLVDARVHETLSDGASQMQSVTRDRERQAASLTAALAEAVGPPVVLKGLTAASLYRERHVRAFGDLDILLREPQLPRAKALLSDMGYVREDAETVDPEEYEQHSVDALSRFVRSPDADLLPVELNGPRNHPYLAGVDISEMIDRAVPSESWPQALRLDWTDALIVCTSHIYCHLTAKPHPRMLRDLGEVAAIIEQHQAQVNWARLVDTVGRFAAAQSQAFANARSAAVSVLRYPADWQGIAYPDVKASVFLGLYLAGRFFGAEVPQAVLRAIFPRHAPELLDMVFQLRTSSAGRSHTCYAWTVGATERLLDLLMENEERLVDLRAIRLLAKDDSWMLPIWGRPWTREMCQLPPPPGRRIGSERDLRSVLSGMDGDHGG